MKSRKAKTSKKVIMIGLDGMPAEFIDRYKEKIPELKKLLKNGFFSPALSSPTTETPTNWTTIATGSWQGTHGITSFHAHLEGMEVNKTTPTFNSNLCQSEYFWQAAERQGKRCILINYPCAFPITLKDGIVIGGDGLASEQWNIRWPDYISTSLRKKTWESDLSVFGEVRSEAELVMKSPEGWTNIPKEYEAIREGTVVFEESEHFNWGALGIIIEEPKKIKQKKVEKRHVMVFKDNDKLKISISKNKDFNDHITILSKGEWSGWVDEQFFGKKCIRQYKLINLSEDGNEITIYGTMGSSLEGWGYPRGIEDEIIRNCGPYIEALELTPDQALHHKWFGKDTCLEIMSMQADWMVKCSEYLSKTQDWDCMFIQYHAPDGMNHMLFNGFWSSNKRKFTETESFMLGVYDILFKMVDRIHNLCADKNTTLCIVSDHGALPVKYYVNTNSIMIREGWSIFKRDNNTGLWDLDINRSKAAFAHWNSGIWINLKGREKNGIVNYGKGYYELRDKIIDRLRKVTNPKTGEPVFDLVAQREALEVLGLWGDRIPDIMAFPRSDYLFAGGSTENITEKMMDLYTNSNDIVPNVLAFEAGVLRPIYASHGNLPCARSKEKQLSSMRAVFFLNGPDVLNNKQGDRVNLVDVCPTLSHIIEIKPPKQCEGRIITEALKE